MLQDWRQALAMLRLRDMGWERGTKNPKVTRMMTAQQIAVQKNPGNKIVGTVRMPGPLAPVDIRIALGSEVG